MKLLRLQKRKQQNTVEKKKVERNYAAAFYDLMAIAGFVSLGYGIYLVYPPAMFIVIGLLTMIIASVLSK